ncbi:hypothetical protein BDM02DRAFT_3132531 [Thelephora ganbajun]|uniref:Uncharacterized protein n=2 Tax=Thelephora ganbajun TaxID=370292 RepID=A0ACB6Z1M3_THEGA|nr:hypothetical protein BDM02DRAFT_3132530 [Thelephora ganbajun]KAF9643290.1 hypothetical protein BDM02DRAFT_3132531 [Thelephora ganbajun]
MYHFAAWLAIAQLGCGIKCISVATTTQPSWQPLWQYNILDLPEHDVYMEEEETPSKICLKPTPIYSGTIGYLRLVTETLKVKGTLPILTNINIEVVHEGPESEGMKKAEMGLNEEISQFYSFVQISNMILEDTLQLE